MVSNNLDINTVTAQSGLGGVFNFKNSAESTVSMTNTDVSTAFAGSTGGIGSFDGGTNVDVTLTDWTVDTCLANSNHGGGFAMTNT